MYFNTTQRLLSLVFCLFVVIATQGASAQDTTQPTEDVLLGVLAADGDYMTHLAAFRGLRQVGTESAVPVVAGFLHDEQKSHLARYVLEPMASDAAGEALRSALEGAPTTVLPGLLTSLGARRDGAAISAITPLLGHGDAAVVHHAKAALGRIATEASVQVLTEALAASPGDVDLAEALLAAAQALVADGNKKAAVPVYQALRKKENPDFIRVGAFKGLIAAAPGKAPPRVLKALQGKSPRYRNLAREAIAETRGKKATAAYVEALPTLPDPLKVEVISGLSRRGDKAAREGVLEALSSESPAVQRAAIEALGNLGMAKDVPVLAELMVSPDAETATVARNSLIRLRGPQVDGALVALLAPSDPETRAGLLNLLDVRVSDKAVPQARKYLDDEAEVVRLAALNVLLQQGKFSEFDAVLNVLKNAPGEAEQSLAGRTLSAIAKHDSEESLPRLLSVLDESDERVQVTLVDGLGAIGGPEALAAITARLEEGAPAVKKKALDVLRAWPTQDAAETLLAMAQSEDEATHDAGLTGYTRLARSHPEHDPKNEMMATAMSLTRSKEEKWMVLSAYGTVHTGPALDALDTQLDDPEVKKEAAMALLKVCEAVKGHGAPAHPRVRKSLELLKAKVDSEYVQKKADELLAGLEDKQ